MSTVSQLKKSWIVAPAKALLNSLLSIDCVNATKVLVTEVPMLAPITMKIADLKGKTIGEDDTK